MAVNVEFDETVDFTRFKTVAIREGHMQGKAPVLNSELTKKRLQAEIERAFTARGLTFTTGAADLTLTYTFGANRVLETRTYPVGWRGRGTRVVNVPQSDGTLVIDLHDANSKALVWRVVANDSESKPAKLADKLDDFARKSASKYPRTKKN